MRLERLPGMLLVAIAFARLVTLVAFAAPPRQTIGTAASDPLSGYVGTWIATNTGETSPFLVLKLSEADGALTGTISRFTVKGLRNGQIAFKPLPQPVDQISYVKISDNGDLSFRWIGDPPFDAGDVEFVAEGTDVAYINDLPISQEAVGRVFVGYWGLGAFYPTVQLHREGTTSSEHQTVSNDWEEDAAARLINQAEFLYKSHRGVYVDYPSLLRSGELEQSRDNFTIVSLGFHSEADPFPGHVIRLVVPQDGAAYQLSIAWKPCASCSASLTSDQTGVVTERYTGDCTNAIVGPR